MSNFKGTPGKWYRNTASRIVSSVYSESREKLIHISGKNDDEAKANAQLISKAPDMLEMLKRARAELAVIRRSMSAHPDCTSESEFDDMTSSAQRMEDEIESVIKSATEL